MMAVNNYLTELESATNDLENAVAELLAYDKREPQGFDDFYDMMVLFYAKEWYRVKKETEK